MEFARKSGGAALDQRHDAIDAFADLVPRRYLVHWRARLFTRKDSPDDKMSAEVALNHHENWDGSGYPGRIDDIFAEKIYLGPGRQAGEIPLPERIVALADVFDALSSERTYKPEWKQEHALRYIRYQAGKKFDPELVGLFINMAELLTAIRNKYSY